MNKRSFFFSAVQLAVAALITHAIARGFLDESMRRKHERVTQALKQQVPYAPDPAVFQPLHTYGILTIIGVALTGLSVASMVTALVRHERGWYLILAMLQFFAVAAAILL